MRKINSYDELNEFIADNKLSLLYASQEGCSVCHGLLPQVEKLLADFPEIAAVLVDTGEVTEVSGQYTIFSVPAILVYVEGKEVIRRARFIPIEQLRTDLSKLVKKF